VVAIFQEEDNLMMVWCKHRLLSMTILQAFQLLASSTVYKCHSVSLQPPTLDQKANWLRMQPGKKPRNQEAKWPNCQMAKLPRSQVANDLIIYGNIKPGICQLFFLFFSKKI